MHNSLAEDSHCEDIFEAFSCVRRLCQAAGADGMLREYDELGEEGNVSNIGNIGRMIILQVVVDTHRAAPPPAAPLQPHPCCRRDCVG